MRKILMTLVLSATSLAALSAGAVDLAKVNGRNITEKDVVTALGNFNEGQRKTILKDSNSKRQVLSNLIEQELLFQQAEKEKLDQDAEFKAALAAFRKQYLSSRLLQKNIGNQLTDKSARAYYTSHKVRFNTDQVHVQHILLADETAAMDMLKKAQAKDADFQALAEKFSKDPSAKNNRGDLGAINRESPFVKEFKDAAFMGSPGEVLGPVKTSYGYHIIKVVDRKSGHFLEYDEVELKVREELRQQLVDEYLSKLRQQAKIQIDNQALEKL